MLHLTLTQQLSIRLFLLIPSILLLHPLHPILLQLTRPLQADTLLILLPPSLWTTRPRAGIGTPTLRPPIRRIRPISTPVARPPIRMRDRPGTIKGHLRPTTVPITEAIRTRDMRKGRTPHSIQTPAMGMIPMWTLVIIVVNITETIVTRRKSGALGTVTMTTIEGSIPGITRPKGETTRVSGSTDLVASDTKRDTTGVMKEGDLMEEGLC